MKNVFSLNNLELVQDDVRNDNIQKYGSFDVILCLGILYHLDAPDLFSFLETVSEMCRYVTLIDTHISQRPDKQYVYKGKTFWGSTYVEHHPKSTIEERRMLLWSSLNNLTSFWLTRPSLYNLISQVGFTSAYECYVPKGPEERDRIMILAVKGQMPELICSPLINAEPAEDLRETRRSGISKFVPISVISFISLYLKWLTKRR